MAEVVGLTASLIGIANLGVNLTRTLYDFGATTSHAREEIDYISNNVSDYADVLELLVEQLEHDRPMHSKKAIRLAERLYDRSHHLFDRIRDLIPDGRRIRDHVSFLQRISWNFKKTRVAHLVGELESLKRTVQLLVQVLCTARQFQAYKDHVGKAEERQKKRETAHRQFLRAENVIVEWQRANEKLPSLREASEREDQLQIQAGSAPPEAKESLPSEETRSLVKVQGNTLAVIEAATVDIGRSESEKRALVLQRTASWLEQLLDEWTVLAQEQETGRPSGEWSSNENAFKPSSAPAAKAGGTDETTGRPKPLPSDRASTQYVTGGVENISENIGRSTSDRKSSVEQSRGEYTPPGYQDFFQQPTNSHGRSQQAKASADVSHSPEILQNPPHASRQSTRDANSTDCTHFWCGEVPGVNNTYGRCVSVHNGYSGSLQSKFEDGTPFSIALKRREKSTEQPKIDHLRRNMNDLVSAYVDAGLHDPLQYDMLAEQIMSDVILKADELQLSEPEARLNRKELIAQAERHLSWLNPGNFSANRSHQQPVAASPDLKRQNSDTS